MDLVVHYFSRVYAQRIRLGWSEAPLLGAGESYVKPELAALQACPDWRERIHVVPGYSSGFLLALAARLSLESVRWVHWSEPSRPWLKWYLTYPVKRLYAMLINRYALGALAIGRLAEEDFVRWGVEAGRIRFLPYSIAALAPPPPRASEVAAPADPVFAFVGVLCRRKGIDILLEAFAEVLARYPRARLRLSGYDESGGAYARLAVRLGIAHAVAFLGSIPAAEISGSIAACDVLVLPSRFDGWGMVLNEAASLGKALIATDACGSAHHLIVPQANGLRVAAEDPPALAAAMLRYCSEPGLASRHGRESYGIFAQFTPQRNAERLQDCLESLALPR